MDWMKNMKAVLFDIDDTLYSQQLSFVRSCQKTFGEAYDLPYDQAFEVYYKTYDTKSNQGLYDNYSMKELHRLRIKKTFKKYGLALSDAQAEEFQKNYFWSQQHMKMTPFMEELLTRCADRYQLGIITNGEGDYQEGKVRALGLRRWIPDSHIIISGRVGIEKPAEQIFRIAQERLGTRPQEMVFVGDSLYNDIAGAKLAGWHQIWINRRGLKRKADQVKADVEVHTEQELGQILLA